MSVYDGISVIKVRVIVRIYKNSPHRVVTGRKSLIQIGAVVRCLDQGIIDLGRFRVKADPSHRVRIDPHQCVKIHRELVLSVLRLLLRDSKLFHFVVLLASLVIPRDNVKKLKGRHAEDDDSHHKDDVADHAPLPSILFLALSGSFPFLFPGARFASGSSSSLPCSLNLVRCSQILIFLQIDPLVLPIFFRPSLHLTRSPFPVAVPAAFPAAAAAPGRAGRAPSPSMVMLLFAQCLNSFSS